MTVTKSFEALLAGTGPKTLTLIHVFEELRGCPCGRGHVVGRCASWQAFDTNPRTAPWQRQDKKKRPRIGGLSRDKLVRMSSRPPFTLNPKNGTVKS